MSRLDHTDNEIINFRKDIRELHDQISSSLLNSVSGANSRSLMTENLCNDMKREHDELKTGVNLAITTELRE